MDGWGLRPLVERLNRDPRAAAREAEREAEARSGGGKPLPAQAAGLSLPVELAPGA